MSAPVIWITGLSGAGKTTLAKALKPCLAGPVVILDGDKVREALHYGNFGYDDAGRRRVGHTYARLAHFLAEQGITVICAVVVMIEEVRHWSRENIPQYIEVFLDIPMEILYQRDFKKVYKQPAGQVVGLDIAPEFPQQPHVTLTHEYDVSQSIATLLPYLESRGVPLR